MDEIKALQNELQRIKDDLKEKEALLEHFRRKAQSRCTASPHNNVVIGTSSGTLSECECIPDPILVQRDLSRALSNTSSLDEGLMLCIEAALAASGLDCGGIYLRDESGALDLVAHKGLPQSFIERASHFEPETANTRLVMAGKSLYTEHLRLGVPLDAIRLQERLRAIAVIPIVGEGRVIGCLNFASHTLDSVPVAARSSLETVAAQIGNSIIRLKTEKRLRESEERFRTFIEQSADGVLLIDEKGTASDWNVAMECITGYPACEVVGKPWIDTMIRLMLPERKTPEQITGFSHFLDALLRTGTVPEKYRLLEGTFYTRDGKRITVEQTIFTIPTPSGYRIGSISRDITKIKRAEELLAAEKERLAVTLHSIGDGVITTDTNGNISTLNKAAEELTGWKTGEAMGKPLLDVFTIIDETARETRENPVQRVLKTGDAMELINHTLLVSKDHREIVIALSGAPIRDNEGSIIGVVLVFRDITERRRLNEALQREQRLESLGILAGGIAHDFNNLLGGIFGYLNIAHERITDGAYGEVRECLTKALDVFDRARSLTQQLLTFSKGGAPVRKTIPLGPLIKKSVQFALSGSNVSYRCDIRDDLWRCDCDENQIGQAIDNIIFNAKEAMPVGGTIQVTAENVSLEKVLGSITPHTGEFIKISIRDQGIGIGKEILPHIFDPFFSTKETGHGLGLSTVFSIVQRHDGWIDVESEPGKGSTFHIFLPASGKPPSNEDDTVSQTTLHKGSGAILVMDDEPFMRDVIGEMLKTMGYSVVKASDGLEAVAAFTKAEESGTPFCACILDLTIPGGMGGKEALAFIRRVRCNVTAIAASGYSEDPVMTKPTDHGFAGKIAKPFRKTELMVLMKRIFPDR